MATLAELFTESRNGPVVFDDREVCRAYSRPLPRPLRLTVAILAGELPAGQDDPVRQGVAVRVRGGRTRLGDELEGTGLLLWSDVTPIPVTIDCLPDEPEAAVDVWNVWGEDDGEIVGCWTGQAGILVEERAGDAPDVPETGSTVLRCSNGLDDVNFDDLLIGLSWALPERKAA
jgi:hypothetical protein